MKKKFKFIIGREAFGKKINYYVYYSCFLLFIFFRPNESLREKYLWLNALYHIATLSFLCFLVKIFYEQYTKKDIVSICAIVILLVILALYLWGNEIVYYGLE